MEGGYHDIDAICVSLKRDGLPGLRLMQPLLSNRQDLPSGAT
jgi:hypothetical protein